MEVSGPPPESQGILRRSEGSPYEPFATDPVIWWSGQGDNINAIFKSGKIDACSYYTSECSSLVLPPSALPAIDLGDEGDPPDPDDPPDDPPPPFSSTPVQPGSQDSEDEAGSIGGDQNPEDPGCFDGVDDDTIDPQTGTEVIQP